MNKIHGENKKEKMQNLPKKYEPFTMLKKKEILILKKILNIYFQI